jgi:hypothetical protein
MENYMRYKETVLDVHLTCGKAISLPMTPAWDDLPRVACPACATTFSLKTGLRGPPIKRSGLAGFVGGLAKTATQSDEMKDAKAFIITREEDGRVYCKER